MKTSIIGMGWATPLGRSLTAVWEAVRDGRRVEPGTLENPFDRRVFPVLRVPEDCIDDVARLPRLRRSSAISHYAVAAAADAATAAGLDAGQLARTALVFVASDGGVVYTRRFYADVVERGPAAGSPLLFPETVYNAPASHIAARLGLAGESLTLVGDAATSLAALRTGCDLIAADEADYCLIAAAQELDWITCEAYVRRGLIRSGSTTEGTVFSEGAAAIVLAREGGCNLQASHPGNSYTTNKDAAVCLDALVADLVKDRDPGLVIRSASGKELEAAENRILTRRLPHARSISPKSTLGESLACSAIQHLIIGAMALKEAVSPTQALIPAIGFNGQMAALVLTGEDSKA
jgi:3-oxoacyl-(acyl-carrier-protein) synthase